MTREKQNAGTHHPSPVTHHFLGLPHRPPFVFVRNLVAREPGVSAECETEFSKDDPMFAGHFPGEPLVPGVILTEALAQTAGIAAHDETSKTRFLLSAIRQMKFLRPVRPEEKIILRARKMGEVDQLLQFEVEAVIGNQPVATGQLVLSAR
ncbi:MAG TPA: 3-hydroxyacyl-ACP dehydratase FabZ family protein [Chthoniobacterales bacterium]|nr:3-hydroxyacyl-ACP dehydratase FabZ family protein [Chthoniobacterales bacterium]